MTGEGLYSLCPVHRLVICLLFYRGVSSVLSLVPVPPEHSNNDTVEVSIYHRECPDGYFRVRNPSPNVIVGDERATDVPLPPPCRLCSSCRRGEYIVTKCSPTNNTRCGCPELLKYSPGLAHCVPPEGLERNWTIVDLKHWQRERNPSTTSQQIEINLTTKVSHNAMMSKSDGAMQESNAQVDHAIKPDWTDFYILTVSSTAVLFFTLSLVLLFLMAVMKARSWYLYRRLPGSGVTLCFRGWLSRVLSRHSSGGPSDTRQTISMVTRTHTDQGTTARDLEAKEDEERVQEPILMTSSPSTPPDSYLQYSEVINYMTGINAIICCADLNFTFPQKKTYVSSCITSEEDVVDTRTRGSPNFILQACHQTVNVVLGQEQHKCCRHRNKLTLESSDNCSLGQFESSTLEVQGRPSGRAKPISPLANDLSETWSLMEEGACQHEQNACIKPEDILNLYMEIATPFKKSPDLKFKGSLRLYLKSGTSHHEPALQEKVKLKYKNEKKKKRDCVESGDTDVDEALSRVEGGEIKRKGRGNIGSPPYSNSEECLVHQQVQTPLLHHRSHGSSSPCVYSGQTGADRLHVDSVAAGSVSPACWRSETGSLEGRSRLYCIPAEQGCLEQPSEAVSESSVEVTVDIHSEELQPLNSPLGQRSGVLAITSV